MQLDNPIEEAFARLTMLEFILEIVLANDLSDIPENISAQVKRDIVLRAREPRQNEYDNIPKDDVACRILNRSAQMTSRFLEKVAEREAEVRAGKAQAL